MWTEGVSTADRPQEKLKIEMPGGVWATGDDDDDGGGDDDDD